MNNETGGFKLPDEYVEELLKIVEKGTYVIAKVAININDHKKEEDLAAVFVQTFDGSLIKIHPSERMLQDVVDNSTYVNEDAYQAILDASNSSVQKTGVKNRFMVPSMYQGLMKKADEWIIEHYGSIGNYIQQTVNNPENTATYKNEKWENT